MAHRFFISFDLLSRLDAKSEWALTPGLRISICCSYKLTAHASNGTYLTERYKYTEVPQFFPLIIVTE